MSLQKATRKRIQDKEQAINHTAALILSRAYLSHLAARLRRTLEGRYGQMSMLTMSATAPGRIRARTMPNHLYTLQQNKLLNTLRRCAIFDRLSDGQLKGLSNTWEEVRYGRDEWILEQGDVGEAFYVITRGSASVMHASPGVVQPTNLSELKEWDFFGERALLRSDVLFAGVRAVSTSLACLRISSDAFERTLGSVKELLIDVQYELPPGQTEAASIKQEQRVHGANGKAGKKASKKSASTAEIFKKGSKAAVRKAVPSKVSGKSEAIQATALPAASEGSGGESSAFAEKERELLQEMEGARAALAMETKEAKAEKDRCKRNCAELEAAEKQLKLQLATKQAEIKKSTAQLARCDKKIQEVQAQYDKSMKRLKQKQEALAMSRAGSKKGGENDARKASSPNSTAAVGKSGDSKLEQLRARLADGHMLTAAEMEALEAEASSPPSKARKGNGTAAVGKSGDSKLEQLRARLADGHMLTAAEMEALETEASLPNRAAAMRKSGGQEATVPANGMAEPLRTGAPGASRFRDKNAFSAYRKQQEEGASVLVPVFL